MVQSLEYLNNKPTTIYWYVVAGNRKLTVLEDHDLIFDDKDISIRFPKVNIKRLNESLRSI